MSVATTTAIGIAGAIGAAGSITSGALGAHAAGKAANAQKQSAANALNFQQQTLDLNKANAAPYQAAGTSALATMQSRLPALTQGFDPTAAGLPSQFSYGAQDFHADPGYAFAVAQGQKAIQNSAAAKGGDVSGAALKSLDAYTTGMADQDYGNAYNRAAGAYQQNYANAFNTYNSNQSNEFNRLQSQIQTGLGANAAVAGTSENFANQASQIAIGAGNAQAAGIVGGTNAITSGIAGATGDLSNTALLNRLLGSGQPNNGSGYGNQFSAAKYNLTPNGVITPDQWAQYGAGSVSGVPGDG